ncbi:hypothetical protein VUR80DRAFT_9613 [Thermomyces stellatus]
MYESGGGRWEGEAACASPKKWEGWVCDGGAGAKRERIPILFQWENGAGSGRSWVPWQSRTWQALLIAGFPSLARAKEHDTSQAYRRIPNLFLKGKPSFKHLRPGACGLGWMAVKVDSPCGMSHLPGEVRDPSGTPPTGPPADNSIGNSIGRASYS